MQSLTVYQLDLLAERAKAKGYDGVLAIRISHPVITQGAVEVVVEFHRGCAGSLLRSAGRVRAHRLTPG